MGPVSLILGRHGVAPRVMGRLAPLVSGFEGANIAQLAACPGSSMPRASGNQHLRPRN